MSCDTVVRCRQVLRKPGTLSQLLKLFVIVGSLYGWQVHGIADANESDWNPVSAIVVSAIVSQIQILQ